MTFLCVDKIMPPKQRRAPRRVREEEFMHGGGGAVPPPPPLPPPPYMPNFRQFWVALMAAAPRQAERVVAFGYSSAHFFRHNSPEFQGNEGPIATDNWITSHEDLADSLH